MPARVIRGEINASESLSRVSPLADLTFRALLVAVDDYGRIDGRLPALRALLFPMRREITEQKLDAYLDELAAGPDAPVIRYESGGRPYIALSGWEKHRGKGRRGGASKCPAPLPRKSGESEDSSELHAFPSEGREARDENREARDEGREAPSAPPVTAPRSDSREVVFPGAMTPDDWDDLATKHRVDAGALYTIAAAWGGEKNRRYKPTGWKLAIDRALRDRWSWTSSLFTAAGVQRAPERESPAQAKERRLKEAALEAFRRGEAADGRPEPPPLLALDGGRR